MRAERTAAIVLAGGRSTRMGTPKADLEWHGSTLLRRVTGIAARAVDGPLVVVRAPGQRLVALPADVELVDDARDGRGPFEALAAGLQAIGDRADLVFVSAVDAPFLHPSVIARVLALVGPDDDVAIPVARGVRQPLAAAYRAATVGPLLCELLEAGGPPGSRALLRRCRVAELGEAMLLADPDVAAHDPALLSLQNVNDPDGYAGARRRAAPAVCVQVGDGAPRAQAAATLLAAARAAGCDLGAVTATVNGRHARDPQEPLVSGDRVVLSAARA